jgi:SAM-dependent methyltransferase
MRRPAVLIALLLSLSATAAAQIASRPAEEWVKVLDGAERLAGLRTGRRRRLEAAARERRRGPGRRVGTVHSRVGDGGRTGRQVYAVEIDKAFPYIERRAKDAGVANVRTVVGEFTDPKLPAADVDVAFMHDVLHHVENREAYLKNLVRYLKPGARVAIIDYHAAQSPHANEPALQVSKEQASAWLAAAGLKPVQEVALFPDKWSVMFRR